VLMMVVVVVIVFWQRCVNHCWWVERVVGESAHLDRKGVSKFGVWNGLRRGNGGVGYLL